MSRSVGKNAGVSGVLDLPGAAGAKFAGEMAGFGQKLAVTTKPRRGRGSGAWAAARAVVSSGSIVLRGSVALTQPPLPTAFRGQEGTLTLQAGFAGGAAQTQSMAVRVVGADFALNEKGGDTWDFAIACELTALPTWAGFGEQPAATDPEKADQEQWGQGTVKTADPSEILTSATRTTDVWGNLADTDAAEADRLAGVIAAAQPPLAGLKLRTATFTRDSDDGGQVVEVWGKTTPAEDIVNRYTQTLIDPDGLNTKVVRAAIGEAPDAPAEVATHGLVEIDTTTVTAEGGASVQVITWGTRSSAEAIEQDGTVAAEDPAGLEDARTFVSVTDDSTPPTAPTVAGLKLREQTSVQRTTDGKWIHRQMLARRSTADDVTMDGSELLVDVGDLRSEDRQAVIDAGSTPPAAPATRDAAIKHVWTRSKQRHDGKWVHVYGYDHATSAERLEFGAYKALRTVDSSDAGGELVELSDSDAPGAAPAAVVAGTQHVRTLTARDERSGKYLHTFIYAILSAEEAKEAEGYSATSDPGAIALVRRGRVRVISSSATPGSAPTTPVTGLVHAGTETNQDARSGRWVHDYLYLPLTHLEAAEAEGSAVEVDPGGLGDQETALEISETSTVPTTPTPANSALSLIGRQSRRRADGRWQHLFRFGRLTSVETIEHRATSTRVDPVRGTVSVTGTISTVLSTDTTATLAAAARAANPLLKVRVSKLNKTQALTLIETYGDDKRVTGRGMHTRRMEVKCLSIGGYGTGPVYVRVADLAGGAPPGLSTRARLAHYQVDRGLGTLFLRRYLSVETEADVTTALHESLRGTVSDATFLGRAARTLMYGGCNTDSLWALVGGDHLLVADYVFHFDSLMHQNESRISVGWCSTATSTTQIGALGDVTASDYFGADKVMLWPDDEDFSVFLA